jgi:hypothetical protein
MARGLEVVRVEKVAESRDWRVAFAIRLFLEEVKTDRTGESRCQFTPRNPTRVMRTYENRLGVTVIVEKPSYVQELRLRIHFQKGTNVLVKLFLEIFLGIFAAAD